MFKVRRMALDTNLAHAVMTTLEETLRMDLCLYILCLVSRDIILSNTTECP